jgi:hypothetical protein
LGSTTWRQRRLIGAAVALSMAVPSLTACGSSSSKPSTASRAAAVSAGLGSPLSQACTAVADVLGNGPDPGDDPVGYAEAQPIQLRKVRTSDVKLRVAIADLADAYETFADTNGSKAAKAAVKAASAKVNAVCPGAVS